MQLSEQEKINLATTWWRQNKAIESLSCPAGEANKLKREVERLHRLISQINVEVLDYTGRRYNNLNVDVLSIEPDPNIEVETIQETVQPEIRIDGRTVQKARVVVHKPSHEGVSVPKFQPANQQAAENEPKANAESSGQNHEVVPNPDQVPTSACTEHKPKRPSFAAVMLASCLALLLGFSAATIILHCFQLQSLTRIEAQTAENASQIIVESNSTNVGKGQEQHTGGQSGNWDGTSLVLVPHTVQQGETLESICTENGLDYPSNRVLITSINALKNPDLIMAGQVIYIPQPTDKEYDYENQ